MKPIILTALLLTACAHPPIRDTWGWSQTFAEFCERGDFSVFVDENGVEHECPTDKRRP